MNERIAAMVAAAACTLVALWSIVTEHYSAMLVISGCAFLLLLLAWAVVSVANAAADALHVTLARLCSRS